MLLFWTQSGACQKTHQSAMQEIQRLLGMPNQIYRRFGPQPFSNEMGENPVRLARRKTISWTRRDMEQVSASIHHTDLCYVCLLLQDRDKLQPPLQMLQEGSLTVSLYLLKRCLTFSPPTWPPAGWKAEQLCGACRPPFRRKWRKTRGIFI